MPPTADDPGLDPITQVAVEAIMRVSYQITPPPRSDPSAEEYAEAVLAAVTPLIRDEIKTAAYKRGYQDRSAERDYDPGSVLDE